MFKDLFPVALSVWAYRLRCDLSAVPSMLPAACCLDAPAIMGFNPPEP